MDNKGKHINVLGLDLSLVKTGYAVVEEGGKVLASGVINSKPCGKKPIDETMRIIKIVEEIQQKIDDLLPNDPPVLVAIEGLAFMAQSTSLVQLAGLNYLTRATLARLKYPFLIVAPTTLKKFITGSGKGEKDKMMMTTYKDYGHEALDNNENDAYCLAICGLALLGKPLKKMTKSQTEVVKLLKSQL